jgi:hypothetical protein
MTKKELTDLLIKEGWIVCSMPQATVPWLLYHPTKHICFRTATSIGPQKSFFVPTQDGKKWMSQNSGHRNQVDAYNPGVSRYIGIGAWGRLKILPDQKLVVDSDEFLAFSYGV